MSENIQSISQGTYTIGQTSATNFVAGPGITIDNPSAGTVRIGNDETVLFETTSPSGTPMTSTFNLSGSMADYEKIKILYRPWNDSIIPEWFEFDYNKRTNSNIMRRSTTFTINPLRFIVCEFNFSADNSFVVSDVRFVDGSFSTSQLDKNRGDIWKVIGINRISGSNA